MLDRVERQPFVENCGSPHRGRLKSRASEAAELVADLLRTTTLEEKRDEVTLGDE